MATTSEMTAQMHVHQPLTQMLMTYTDKTGKKFARLHKMGNHEDERLMLKTIRWASNHGVEILLRPA